MALRVLVLALVLGFGFGLWLASQFPLPRSLAPPLPHEQASKLYYIKSLPAYQFQFPFYNLRLSGPSSVLPFLLFLLLLSSSSFRLFTILACYSRLSLFALALKVDPPLPLVFVDRVTKRFPSSPPRHLHSYLWFSSFRLLFQLGFVRSDEYCVR